MKRLLVAGNWKSNKTISESTIWWEKQSLQTDITQAAWNNLTVVVFAPFTALAPISKFITSQKLPLALGAQDISPFGDGPYTGEVSGRMVAEVASWVLIGHSERRIHFGEKDEMLAAKASVAKNAGLKIIYCVPDTDTKVPFGVDAVAYEPIWAIGTGKTDTPQNADNVIANIKNKTGVSAVIYGGSVTADNVASFVAKPAIDGVLPGGASLDPHSFTKLVAGAATATS